MEETGVANVADPLGGSWYVEALTDRIEADAEKIFEQIKERGAAGASRRASTRSARSPPASCAASRTAGSPARSPSPPSATSGPWRRATSGSSASTATTARSPATWRSCGSATRSSASRCGSWPPARTAGTTPRCAAALDAMLAAARDGGNMIAPMLDAVRAEATLGEICGVLRDEWGVYTEPAGLLTPRRPRAPRRPGPATSRASGRGRDRGPDAPAWTCRPPPPDCRPRPAPGARVRASGRARGGRCAQPSALRCSPSSRTR